MKCFKYKIYNGDKLILSNWINSESKEKAFADLQQIKEEMNGTEIKLSETSSANNWKC